jgi:hypothetical protein
MIEERVGERFHQAARFHVLDAEIVQDEKPGTLDDLQGLASLAAAFEEQRAEIAKIEESAGRSRHRVERGHSGVGLPDARGPRQHNAAPEMDVRVDELAHAGNGWGGERAVERGAEETARDANFVHYGLGPLLPPLRLSFSHVEPGLSMAEAMLHPLGDALDRLEFCTHSGLRPAC